MLANLLRTRTDIKPNMTGANWEFAADSPWPPVQRILKTVFWTADIYSSIRERISRPAPVVELEEKSDYITVRTTDVRSGPAEEELNLEVHPFTTPNTDFPFKHARLFSFLFLTGVPFFYGS